MAITTGENVPAVTIAMPAEGDAHAQTPTQPDATPKRKPRRQNRKRNVVCRYIQRGEECKAGNDCQFLHTQDSTAPDDTGKRRPKGKATRTRKGKPDTFRKTQIEDLLRAPRLTVKRLSSDRNETALAVEMRPSDPDFPFDVSRLYMALVVPGSYPTARTSDAMASIQVANKNIPAGVKRNIEVMFGKYVRKTVNQAIESGNPENVPALEEYVDWLDKNLENMMQQKPATTMKFTTFNKPAPLGEKLRLEEKQQPKTDDDLASHSSVSSTTTQIPASRPPVRRPVPRPLQTASTAAAAAATAGTPGDNPRRTIELQQLQRRFRSTYSIASDDPAGDTVVSIDIVPSDPDMPVDVTLLRSELVIARTYPDTPDSATLRLKEILGRKNRPTTWNPPEGYQPYMDFIELCFKEHVKASPANSLLHHLNWLDRQLVDLLTTPPPPLPVPSVKSQKPAPLSTEEKAAKPALFEDDTAASKPWVRTISISEAGLPADVAAMHLNDSGNKPDNGSSSSDLESDPNPEPLESDSDENSDGGFSKPLRRGIEIRFGKTELANISLAHCHSLNLNVRCARCKTNTELKAIAPTLRTGRDNQMWKSCDSCASLLGVRFRPDWMFQGTTTLGFLDCSGCAPIDLLPSKLTLSCEKCAMGDDDDNSHTTAADTIVAVSVGSPLQTNCKTCFQRLKIALSEPQFVQLMSGPSLGGSGSASQIQKEVARTRKAKVDKRAELAKLGVVPGQPLPDRGACKHYRKSNRWLRFPCCGKAYPCGECHDDKEDHPHEFAQNMICGLCAKEQRIAKADLAGVCIGCGGQVVRKVDGNNAFWQGGMGVRDKTRMSRKDTKKYQGIGKTISNHKLAQGKK